MSTGSEEIKHGATAGGNEAKIGIFKAQGFNWVYGVSTTQKGKSGGIFKG